MATSQLELFPEDLITLSALCKKHNRGCAANRKKTTVKKAEKIYAVLLPHSFENNDLGVKGSVTWGSSGFNFSVSVQSLNKLTVKITSHKNFDLTTENAEDILFEFMGFCKDKLLKKETGKKEIRRSNNKNLPCIQAWDVSSKKDRMNNERINQWYTKGVFDAEFKDYLIQHANLGIKCRGAPSKA